MFISDLDGTNFILFTKNIKASRFFETSIFDFQPKSRFFNSVNFLLGGVDIAPVKIYPTVVEGNTLNLKMAFPVHRMNIISLDGKQVMQKDLGGITGTTQVVVPVLNRGQYLVTFYGNGWQSTEKFMISGN